MQIACNVYDDYQGAMTLTDLANPTKFLALTARILPWLAGATAVLLAIGLYQSAMAPDDYQQGATVKIMFIHVPNAWLSMFVWGVMSVAALGTLVWRHPLADVAAKAAAPIGAAFTFLALVTGSLWGRPMWGTYWEWDARLTSVLILFLMYLGLIALWRAVDDPSRAARAAAILTLVGAINLPIIKFSVDWWNTLHQPASAGVPAAPRRTSDERTRNTRRTTAKPTLGGGAAADRLCRAGRIVPAAAARRRSVQDSLRSDRPPGAADRAAGAGRARQQWR